MIDRYFKLLLTDRDTIREARRLGLATNREVEQGEAFVASYEAAAEKNNIDLTATREEYDAEKAKAEDELNGTEVS